MQAHNHCTVNNTLDNSDAAIMQNGQSSLRIGNYDGGLWVCIYNFELTATP